MSSSPPAPQQQQQPGPALTTSGDSPEGPPFRFAPPKTHEPSQMGSSSGWNEIPPQRHSLPAGFFDTPTAKMYLAFMDDEMDAARRTTRQGWTTRLAFKEAFYRAERRFRAWLVQQPHAVFWDFVNAFNIYDQRVALMTLRYENRRSGQVALRAQLQDHRQKHAA